MKLKDALQARHEAAFDLLNSAAAVCADSLQRCQYRLCHQF